MSVPSSSPELVVLSDSESSDEGEGPPQNVGKGRKSGEYSNSQRAQVEQALMSTQQQQLQKRSTDSSHFLKEIFEIVQWVNTGVKRKESCEKTLMEKKFDEMEKTIKEQGERLEHANLEICVLKQIKTAMEVDNNALKQELEMAKTENTELNGKWVTLKETFQTLQSKYFEEVPGVQKRIGGETVQGASNKEQLLLTQVKEEPEEVTVPMQVNLFAGPVNTNQAIVAFGGNLPIEQAPAQLAPANDPTSEMRQPVTSDEQMELPATVSEPATVQQQASGSRGSDGHDKPHGVDKSREHEGAVCLCGLQFSSKRTLDSHIIYFTCERKFSCHICQKRFVGSNYLKGHMLRSHKVIYTGGSNGCRDCGKTFITLLELRQHKKIDHPIQEILKPAIKKSSYSGKLSASTKHRRSIRMRRRHQKGAVVNNALKMLQGNCSNCQFCREQQNKSKLNPAARSCIAVLVGTRSSITAAASRSNNNVSILSPTATPAASSTVTVPTPPVTRNATRALNRSRSSSTESISFSCDYCQKWFGDDKSGLIKHQQMCSNR